MEIGDESDETNGGIEAYQCMYQCMLQVVHYSLRFTYMLLPRELWFSGTQHCHGCLCVQVYLPKTRRNTICLCYIFSFSATHEHHVTDVLSSITMSMDSAQDPDLKGPPLHQDPQAASN